MKQNVEKGNAYFPNALCHTFFVEYHSWNSLCKNDVVLLDSKSIFSL